MQTKIFILSLSIFINFFCQPIPYKKEKIPKKDYQRIIPANIFSAEILWRLGKSVRKKVIAIPRIIDNQRYSNFVGIWPSHVHRFNRVDESLIRLKPDLIILANFNIKNYEAVFQTLKIETLHLEAFTGFASYLNNLKKIALFTKAEKQGKELRLAFQKRLEKIRKTAKKIKAYKTISYLHGNTAGSGTTLDEILNLAGLVNLSAQKGIRSFQPLSVEQILLWSPDFILISCELQNCSEAAKKFPYRLGLKASVIQSRIIAIPANLLTSVNEDMLTLAERLQREIL